MTTGWELAVSGSKSAIPGPKGIGTRIGLGNDWFRASSRTGSSGSGFTRWFEPPGCKKRKEKLKECWVNPEVPGFWVLRTMTGPSPAGRLPCSGSNPMTMLSARGQGNPWPCLGGSRITEFLFKDWCI